MSHRTLRLVAVAGGVLVLGLFGISLLSPTGGTGPASLPAPASAPKSPAPDEASPPAVRHRSVRTYAVAAPELHGLPPDVQTGARFELWALWEPPITKRPRLQKLLEEVRVERVAPSMTEDSPPAVLLSVESRDIGALLWADRYGQLAVVALGDAAPGSP